MIRILTLVLPISLLATDAAWMLLLVAPICGLIAVSTLWGNRVNATATSKGDSAASNQCECTYPGCSGHKDDETCAHSACIRARRIDMNDGTRPFVFCEACAVDALDSGVFA